MEILSGLHINACDINSLLNGDHMLKLFPKNVYVKNENTSYWFMYAFEYVGIVINL